MPASVLSSLSTIFEQASKGVPRAVLYAGVIPAIAAIIANGAIAGFLLGPGAIVILTTVLNQSWTTTAGWLGVASLFVLIVGMAIASLAPLFRTLLQGRRISHPWRSGESCGAALFRTR